MPRKARALMQLWGVRRPGGGWGGGKHGRWTTKWLGRALCLKLVLKHLFQKRPSSMRSPQQEAPPSTAFTRGVRKKDLVIREKQGDYGTLRGSMERHSLITTLASLPLIPDVAMAPINTQGENVWGSRGHCCLTAARIWWRFLVPQNYRESCNHIVKMYLHYSMTKTDYKI